MMHLALLCGRVLMSIGESNSGVHIELTSEEANSIGTTLLKMAEVAKEKAKPIELSEMTNQYKGKRP